MYSGKGEVAGGDLCTGTPISHWAVLVGKDGLWNSFAGDP